MIRILYCPALFPDNFPEIAFCYTEFKNRGMLAGNLVAVAGAVLTEGTAALARFSIQMFRPLKPMLAQTAVDVEDALSRLGSAATRIPITRKMFPCAMTQFVVFFDALLRTRRLPLLSTS